MSDDDIVSRRAKEKSAVSDGGESLPSRVFGALVNPRRRYVLYYLRDRDRAQTDDLAAQITAWERDVRIEDAPAEASERVHAELVQSHLPKLDDYGFVEYDRRSSAVRYTYPPTLLDDVIELADTIEGPRR